MAGVLIRAWWSQEMTSKKSKELFLPEYNQFLHQVYDCCLTLFYVIHIQSEAHIIEQVYIQYFFFFLVAVAMTWRSSWARDPPTCATAVTRDIAMEKFFESYTSVYSSKCFWFSNNIIVLVNAQFVNMRDFFLPLFILNLKWPLKKREYYNINYLYFKWYIKLVRWVWSASSCSPDPLPAPLPVTVTL